MASSETIASGELRPLNRLLYAIKPLANVRPSMPLTQVTALLFVAIDEGHGVGEYARMAGVHRAAMSRTLRDIGARNRTDGPGHGLVEVQPHPAVKRKKQVVLTAKGRAIVHQIVKRLRDPDRSA